MRDIKTQFLAASFDYLTENGLESMSIRNLCKSTGISIGSVYYWFDDKEDLIASTAEYGLGLVLERAFEYALDRLDNLDILFDNFIAGADKGADKIRFICQVVSSPLYGDKIRAQKAEHSYLYEKYTRALAEKLEVSYDDIQPIVFLMASLVLDYSVWGNKESTKCQIDFLKKMLNTIIGK